MSIEFCFLCEGEAMVERITVDKYDVRCEKCGKYIFLDGLHEGQYNELSEREREIISNYVREFNEATKKWAQLGDIEILWKVIEDFNRRREKNRV